MAWQAALRHLAQQSRGEAALWPRADRNHGGDSGAGRPALAAVAHGSSLRGTSLVAHAWMIGATLANSSFLLVHEISHDLVFKAEWANRVLGMVAQLPLLAPMAESFRYYHAFHHKALGVEDTDPDIPTAWEEQLLQLPGALGVGVRLVALALNMIPYLFRPILLHGPPPVSGFMLLNVALQAAFDAAFLAIFGWPGVLYTFWAILFAGGLHPSAAHFISEHVAVDERMLSTGQATASSYNWLQALTQFNAGCHTEHHDLPCVPWTRLPLVRRYAPEHYNHLVSHRSATGVIVRFVLGNCRRVKTHAQ